MLQGPRSLAKHVFPLLFFLLHLTVSLDAEGMITTQSHLI